MSHKNIPELSFLLSEVEKKYGRRVATSTDFETLSVVIEMETGKGFFNISIIRNTYL